MVRAAHAVLSCVDIIFGRGSVSRLAENNISNINALAFYHKIRWNLDFSGDLANDYPNSQTPLVPGRPSRLVHLWHDTRVRSPRERRGSLPRLSWTRWTSRRSFYPRRPRGPQGSRPL